MDSKFQLSFNSLGYTILFRGRSASTLRSLDWDLLVLTYFDPNKPTVTPCPEQFISVRSERFLFNYYALPIPEQSVILSFFNQLILKHPDFSGDLGQRAAYYDLLSLDPELLCRRIRSKESFTRCFLYAYYAFILRRYNSDFSFD